MLISCTFYSIIQYNAEKIAARTVQFIEILLSAIHTYCQQL